MNSSLSLYLEDLGFNTTVAPPDSYFSANTTAPSNGLQKFVIFLGNNIWVPIVCGVVLALAVVLIAIIGIRKFRRNSKFDYRSIEEHVTLPERMQMQKEDYHDTSKNVGFLQCQLYLRSNAHFKLSEQLPQLGARSGKQWFLVKDVATGVQKMLTITPKGHHMAFSPNSSNRSTLVRIFAMLQHPYILPIEIIDFLVEDESSVIIQPYTSKGSLRDYIRNTKCKSNTQLKQMASGKPLPVPQIQLFGRHILEALLFIEEYDLPPMMHLHTGNVILQNFNCRISGIENCFLGQTPRNVKLLKKSCKDLKSYRYHHCVCFGHVLFEMATGREVGKYPPAPEDWEDVTNTDLREVLKFVLYGANKHPTIQQIIHHDFFHGITTRELVGYTPPRVNKTKQMKALMKTVRDESNLTSKKKEGKSAGSQARKLKSERQSHVTSNTPKVNEVEEVVTTGRTGLFNGSSGTKTDGNGRGGVFQGSSSGSKGDPTERSGLMEYTYTVAPSHGSTSRETNLL